MEEQVEKINKSNFYGNFWFLLFINFFYFLIPVCYSQSNTQIINGFEIEKKPIFSHLNDCKIYEYSSVDEEKVLTTTFRFDKSGLVTEIVYTSIDDTSKTVFLYDKRHLKLGIHYSKTNIDSIYKNIIIPYEFNNAGKLAKYSIFYYWPEFDKSNIQATDTIWHILPKNWERDAKYLGNNWDTCGIVNRKYENDVKLVSIIGKSIGPCNMLEEGTINYYYDSLGRKSHSKYYLDYVTYDKATEERKIIKDSLRAVTKYEYSDKRVKTTTISEMMIYEIIYTKDEKNRLVRKEQMVTQGIKNDYSAGYFIPNIDTTATEFNLQSFSDNYFYDSYDRIIKIVNVSGEYSDTKEIIYNKKNKFGLPKNLYLEITDYE